jgi:hypothetical protein
VAASISLLSYIATALLSAASAISYFQHIWVRNEAPLVERPVAWKQQKSNRTSQQRLIKSAMSWW